MIYLNGAFYLSSIVRALPCQEIVTNKFYSGYLNLDKRFMTRNVTVISAVKKQSHQHNNVVLRELGKRLLPVLPPD